MTPIMMDDESDKEVSFLAANVEVLNNILCSEASQLPPCTKSLISFIRGHREPLTNTR